MEESEDTKGLCYETAGRHLLKNQHGGDLVHGICNLPNGKSINHAWVDEGKMQGVFEPEQGVHMPHHEFHGNFSPTEIARYGKDAMIKNMSKFNHWGPWHDETAESPEIPKKAIKMANKPVPYAKAKDKSWVAQKPGAPTARYTKLIPVPVKYLGTLPGLRGEHQVLHPKMEKVKCFIPLVKDLRFQREHPIELEVHHNGSVVIADGNHRKLAATLAHIDTYLCKVTFFGGSEDEVSFDKVMAKYAAGNRLPALVQVARELIQANEDISVVTAELKKVAEDDGYVPPTPEEYEAFDLEHGASKKGFNHDIWLAEKKADGTSFQSKAYSKPINFPIKWLNTLKGYAGEHNYLPPDSPRHKPELIDAKEKSLRKQMANGYLEPGMIFGGEALDPVTNKRIDTSHISEPQIYEGNCRTHTAGQRIPELEYFPMNMSHYNGHEANFHPLDVIRRYEYDKKKNMRTAEQAIGGNADNFGSVGDQGYDNMREIGEDEAGENSPDKGQNRRVGPKIGTEADRESNPNYDPSVDKAMIQEAFDERVKRIKKIAEPFLHPFDIEHEHVNSGGGKPEAFAPPKVTIKEDYDDEGLEQPTEFQYSRTLNPQAPLHEQIRKFESHTPATPKYDFEMTEPRYVDHTEQDFGIGADRYRQKNPPINLMNNFEERKERLKKIAKIPLNQIRDTNTDELENLQWDNQWNIPDNKKQERGTTIAPGKSKYPNSYSRPPESSPGMSGRYETENPGMVMPIDMDLITDFPGKKKPPVYPEPEEPEIKSESPVINPSNFLKERGYNFIDHNTMTDKRAPSLISLNSLEKAANSTNKKCEKCGSSPCMCIGEKQVGEVRNPANPKGATMPNSPQNPQNPKMGNEINLADVIVSLSEMKKYASHIEEYEIPFGDLKLETGVDYRMSGRAQEVTMLIQRYLKRHVFTGHNAFTIAEIAQEKDKFFVKCLVFDNQINHEVTGSVTKADTLHKVSNVQPNKLEKTAWKKRLVETIGDNDNTGLVKCPLEGGFLTRSCAVCPLAGNPETYIEDGYTECHYDDMTSWLQGNSVKEHHMTTNINQGDK